MEKKIILGNPGYMYSFRFGVTGAHRSFKILSRSWTIKNDWTKILRATIKSGAIALLLVMQETVGFRRALFVVIGFHESVLYDILKSTTDSNDQYVGTTSKWVYACRGCVQMKKKSIKYSCVGWTLLTVALLLRHWQVAKSCLDEFDVGLFYLLFVSTRWPMEKSDTLVRHFTSTSITLSTYISGYTEIK